MHRNKNRDNEYNKRVSINELDDVMKDIKTNKSF